MRVDSLPAEPQGEPKNTGVGSLSLLQGIFPTQESNQALLRCRQILYQLSYQGSPRQTSLRLKGCIFRLNKSRGGFNVCVCVCVRVLVAQSRPLCVIPWTAARQAPLSVGFSRQEHWSCLPFPSPGVFPTQGVSTHLCVSCSGRWILYPVTTVGGARLQHHVCRM